MPRLYALILLKHAAFGPCHAQGWSNCRFAAQGSLPLLAAKPLVTRA